MSSVDLAISILAAICALVLIFYVIISCIQDEWV